jgi:hypothetical protein
MPALLYVAEAKLDQVRLVPKGIIERRESRTEENWHE